MSKIPATHFVQTLSVNVDNKKLSDADFREFVRNTLSIVDYPPVDRSTKPVPTVIMPVGTICKTCGTNHPNGVCYGLNINL